MDDDQCRNAVATAGAIVIEDRGIHTVASYTIAGSRNRPRRRTGQPRRFDAARHTIALRRLAVLWKQRTKRAAEFTALHERVRALQS